MGKIDPQAALDRIGRRSAAAGAGCEHTPSGGKGQRVGRTVQHRLGQKVPPQRLDADRVLLPRSGGRGATLQCKFLEPAATGPPPLTREQEAETMIPSVKAKLLEG